MITAVANPSLNSGPSDERILPDSTVAASISTSTAATISEAVAERGTEFLEPIFITRAPESEAIRERVKHLDALRTDIAERVLRAHGMNPEDLPHVYHGESAELPYRGLSCRTTTLTDSHGHSIVVGETSSGIGQANIRFFRVTLKTPGRAEIKTTLNLHEVQDLQDGNTQVVKPMAERLKAVSDKDLVALYLNCKQRADYEKDPEDRESIFSRGANYSPLAFAHYVQFDIDHSFEQAATAEFARRFLPLLNEGLANDFEATRKILTPYLQAGLDRKVAAIANPLKRLAAMPVAFLVASQIKNQSAADLTTNCFRWLNGATGKLVELTMELMKRQEESVGA